MPRGRTLLLGAAAAATLVFGAAGPAAAKTFRGTVVHRNAHKAVVATSSGRLVAVHTRHAPRVGRYVRVSGTHLRTIGRRHHARLRGTVTYVSRSKRLFTLSSRGASVLVHARRLRAGRARMASDSMPQSGSEVATDTEIEDDGDLQAKDVKDEGDDNDGIELEGKILGKDEGARTLNVSADEDDESGDAVTVHVPGSFDMSTFKVGDEVELKVTKESDGSFTLTKAESDDDNNHGDDNDNKGDDDGNDD